MVNLGGKAKNLTLLRRKGLNIPYFFVVSSDEISRRSIVSIKEEILEKTKNWEEGLILRSSADCEDGNKYSFAGLFESVIIKNSDEINGAIEKIIKSSDAKRVQDYLKLKDIKNKPKVSIIVQRFMEGNTSGVIFNLDKDYIINSNPGTALSIVQGKACDEYLINKKDKRIEIVNKVHNSLSQKQIISLIKIADKVNEIFGSCQDIEWTIKDNNLFVLQSRPVTEFNKKEKILVWDNSNIAESYSGIVLPLTYSFAKRMYSKVYRQVAFASGVSRKKISEYGSVFDEMLGHFYGRFYYNMENWYKMLTLFPGYKSNKLNFDRMISIQSKTELEEDYKKNVGPFFKIKYYPLIFFKFIRFNSEIKKFEKRIKQILEEFSKKDLNKISRENLFKEFQYLEKCFISVWHIPIENDFLAMTFNGFLIKEAIKKGLTESEVLDQLSGIGNLKTAQQTEDLISLAKSPNIQNIEKYFKIYGGRFVNELKLESEELTRDSREFKELLNSYKNIVPRGKKEINSIDLGRRGNFYLKQTKKYLRQREELRILRAKVFSLSRKIFLEMGRKMKNENIIENHRDIFYLELNELLDNVLGKRLKKEIKLRKIEYKEYEKINPGNILHTKEDKEIIITNNIQKELVGDLIKGRPCSNGEVYDQVNLIKNSTPSFNKNYGIIITETADPGWAPILSICKGIIIEKGGILSHISILARELGVPCIINVPGIMQKIKKGDMIYMNGSTGEIKIGKHN
jgi:phosphohistidine swiveling domain-containing protein